MGENEKKIYCPLSLSNDIGNVSCLLEKCGFWSRNLNCCSIVKMAEAQVEIAHWLDMWMNRQVNPIIQTNNPHGY